MHRALTPQIDLASALSHVEQRVISNDYTFSFAGRRYQIARTDVKAGMRGKSLRIELRLSGALRARFEGQYAEVSECGAKAPVSAEAGWASRCARITIGAARAIGWRASSNVRGRRYGKRCELANERN